MKTAIFFAALILISAINAYTPIDDDVWKLWQQKILKRYIISQNNAKPNFYSQTVK